ncbi:alpha-xylosidase, partial [Lachnotalea glycerini]
MKFSNGCWLLKEGYESFSPKQVFRTKLEKDMVTIYAPTNHIKHRGDTLGGVNLTIQITVPAPEVIRVQTIHYMGVVHKTPEFELNYNTNTSIQAEEDESQITITSGSLKLIITKNDWSMTYVRDKEMLTKSAGNDLAYVKTDWKGYAYDRGEEDNTYMRQQLSLSVGELIYGLGERFTPFVKNGQTVDIWNEDGGTSTEQSYKNIPFYITNKGYGVFVNHPEKVS